MALQDILQKILDEAAAEVKNIEASTIEDKKQLKSEADEQTATLLDELKAKKAEALGSIEAKTNAMARRDAKSRLQEARRNVITMAMEKFLEHLVALPNDQYSQVLEKLFAPISGQGTIYAPKAHMAVTKKAAPKGFSVQETEDIKGGFIIKFANSEVDCSFESIVFSEYRNEIESFFAQKLNLI